MVDDAAGGHDAAVAAGARSVREPVKLEQWKVTMAMVEDADGYLVELIQRRGH
jgi:hypothetical protein